jgi:hypothetical protein
VKFIGRRKFQIRSGLGGGAVAAFPDPRSYKAFVYAVQAFDEVYGTHRHVIFRGVLGGEGGRSHLLRRCSILTALDGIPGSLRRGKVPWDEPGDGSSFKGPVFRSAGTTVEMSSLLSGPVHSLSTKEKQ